MKEFIYDRSTDTLEATSNIKIPTYNDLASLNADLALFEEGDLAIVKPNIYELYNGSFRKVLSEKQGGAITGTVLPFAGSTPPNGYLLCDGRAVSRSDYASLFNVIGVTYGVGDGSTTFNLPDLRETVVKGYGLSGLSSTHYSATPKTIGSFIEGLFKTHSHPQKGQIRNSFSTSTSLANSFYSNNTNRTSGGASARNGPTNEVKSMVIAWIIKY